MLDAYNKKNLTVYNKNAVGVIEDLPTAEDPAEIEKEFKTLKVKQPLLTKTGHEYMRETKDAVRYTSHKAYNELYDGQKMLAAGGCGQSVDRDLNIAMRYVHFDKNGIPVSKEDRENHRWNLKWIKANMEKDEAVVEDMLSEQLPKEYDWFKAPKMPTEAQIKDPKQYITVLDSYFDKLLANKNLYKQFVVSSKKGLSFDSYKAINKSFAQYLLKDAKFRATSDLLVAMSNYLSNYLQEKYLIDAKGELIGELGLTSSGKKSISKDDTKHMQEGAKKSKEIMAQSVVSFLRIYNEHKNDKEVKFK
jgi:hypothetical protein